MTTAISADQQYGRTGGVFLGHHKVTLKYHLSADEETHVVPPKASKELREVIDRYK